jgi:hypothetical protein
MKNIDTKEKKMNKREQELLSIIMEEHRLIEHRLATRDVEGIHEFIMEHARAARSAYVELISLQGIEQASQQWNRMLAIVYAARHPIHAEGEES